MREPRIIFLPILITVFVTACAGSNNGEQLFTGEGCINCHTFKGRGGSIGPDLTAVSSRRDKKWMLNYIKDPSRTNPAARMPSFPQLSETKRRAIVSYLRQELGEKP